jgi:MoaA/NifB/PqqE/SkfB family radical SAM enzyme
MKPCILPWINFSTTTFGRPRVCGYSDDKILKKINVKLKDSTITKEWNNDYFKEIRRDFLAGKWPENCKRCKYVENLDGISKRQDENGFWYDQYKHLIEHTQEDGSVNYDPPHIDVRTGTICNLKCIHCGTGASSKWKEDKLLLNKYPNTGDFDINNKWIEIENEFWNSLRDSWHQTKRYNFLGGESFANKRHNEFLKDLSETEYAKDVNLAYVTNGSLINEDRLKQLSKFNSVVMRLSVDALGTAGEYFRYPIKWDSFTKQLEMINRFVKDKENFDIGVQWTCSNISMFYLTETYDIIRNQFPNIKFLFCNHVEWPVHMSAQNLPLELKLIIKEKIENYNFKTRDLEDYPFYVNHMMEKDLWSEHGITFMQYLDDLDIARNISWKYSFKEMNLEKYDLRK